MILQTSYDPPENMIIMIILYVLTSKAKERDYNVKEESF